MSSDNWNEATTWKELLALNEEYIVNSFKKKDPCKSPYQQGPREDCENKEDVKTLLRLHDYGLLVKETGGDWHGTLPTIEEDKGIKTELRAIPCLEFIVIKDSTTQLFVDALLRDPKLAVCIWKGRNGEPYEPKKHTHFSIWIRWSSKTGTWSTGASSPKDTWVSLEDFLLEDVKALEGKETYFCMVAMKIDDVLYKTTEKEDFVRAIKNFDLIHEVVSRYKAAVAISEMVSRCGRRVWRVWRMLKRKVVLGL